MLKKSNIYRVLEVFFDDPLPEGIGFQLREISRNIGLAPKSVKSYLKMLENEGLIAKKKHRIHNYPVYYANRDGDYFRFLKRLNIITRIKESGLLGHISEKCMPETIILFGSASRGEDIKGSDIDLYIQCERKVMDLNRYERKLKREINPFFEKNFDRLSEELKNNILNGDRLKGYLKVKMARWKG
ncbi:nucleotidyltransferase domain-containing protein [Candidatus Woesearchaeota archaeon]|nr:nucleotidyltransferase domain-containing protein [Candidatus Woesearchaeota archaeon]